jgi:predicted SAM-dependent methyltransferase
MIKRFLHVGCGPAKKGPRTPGFAGDGWDEIRLDIDASVNPDVIASITDLSPIETASLDAVFSSHNIEHLYPHEAPLALREFHRVLNNDGFVVITCPDIASVAAYIANNGLDSVAYMSGMGPITPLDMVFGHNASIQNGNVYMAHRTAFTRKTLQKALSQSGYGSIMTFEKPARFELWALATKTEQSRAKVVDLVMQHIPGCQSIRDRLMAE